MCSCLGESSRFLDLIIFESENATLENLALGQFFVLFFSGDLIFVLEKVFGNSILNTMEFTEWKCAPYLRSYGERGSIDYSRQLDLEFDLAGVGKKNQHFYRLISP